MHTSIQINVLKQSEKLLELSFFDHDFGFICLLMVLCLFKGLMHDLYFVLSGICVVNERDM